MSHEHGHFTLGALPEDGGVRFGVWAPAAQRVEVVLEPNGKLQAMDRDNRGYFHSFVPGIGAGSLYRYRLDGESNFPDPASRFQPYGVHGVSEVVDPYAYEWQDEGWQGVPHKDLVFYELHVGTFTPEGSFEAARQKLSHLKQLGITALELMPLADFPGRWNWGYDVAALFAPARCYGRPDELRRLVDEAHRLGLAVYLDVVYNHLGPDGAYAAALNPFYFTERHHTPWGQAINLDGQHSESVRQFLLANALHWLNEYRLDGLRLDATHALIDDGKQHFLAELSAVVAGLQEPRRHLIAEDERNFRRLIEPRETGGYGLDAVWADDFHHQVRRALAGDSEGYYRDFSGSTEDTAKTIEQGWFFTGQHSEHLGGRRGTDPAGLAKERFVFCIQNHDQIGNRPLGDRLSQSVSRSALRAATALLFFVPELPLVFMGQEWAATTAFQYFTDHHGELGELVSRGRQTEFKDFSGFLGDVPDPQNPETFWRSKLDWGELEHDQHAKMLKLHTDLLSLRRELNGEVTAEAPGAGGLSLCRGRHKLLVAIAEGVEFPLADGYREIWGSETPAYADNPSPPQFRSGAVYFPTPGAVLLEATL